MFQTAIKNYIYIIQKSACGTGFIRERGEKILNKT
jgi:hypothetical protein